MSMKGLFWSKEGRLFEGACDISILKSINGLLGSVMGGW